MRQVRTAVASLLITLVSATALVAAEPSIIGRVKKASGAAYLIRGGERLPAAVGDPVHAGDGIETGADGRLGITLMDNTMFAAGPDTKMSLDQYQFDSKSLTGNMLADLQQGTLSIVSGDMTKVSPDALKVRTPRAILGVRGTELLVRVEGAPEKQAQN